MKEMKCIQCGITGGAFRVVKGEDVCMRCLKLFNMERRTRAPAIRGAYKPWFNWQTGAMVENRMDERVLETAGPVGTIHDKSFISENLGISAEDMASAVATTKKDTFNRDALLNSRAEKHAKSFLEKSPGGKPWGDPTVQSVDPMGED